MSLTLEEKTLLLLVRSQITGEPCEESIDFSAVDWSEVLRESVRQAVLLMAYESVSAFYERIPAVVYDQWSQMAFASLANNAQVEHSQKELVQKLQCHFIFHSLTN